MKKYLRTLALAIPLTAGFSAPAFSVETIKIANIEGFTGWMAPLSQNRSETLRFYADIANKEQWAGPDFKFEISTFDGKASPQESLLQMRRAIDQGFRYIVSGNGSNVTMALVDAADKHNSRNPGKEVLIFNVAAVDPRLAGENCSFYSFHFDSNSKMKMDVLTTYMAKDESIKKVYIIGQDYSHGQDISRFARSGLKDKRPDIEIVGDDLHPISTVKDFAPYVAKIKASGADTVITGNWGTDLTLLIRAANDAGVDARFYSYYANDLGAPTAFGSAGENKVFMVNNWHANLDYSTEKGRVAEYKEKYDDSLLLAYTHSALGFLANAVKTTGSLDPIDNAFAMEDATFNDLHGEVTMRGADHQIQQPLTIAMFAKANDTDTKYDQEDTGFGWRTVEVLDPSVAMQPSTCKMKRPSR